VDGLGARRVAGTDGVVRIRAAVGEREVNPGTSGDV